MTLKLGPTLAFNDLPSTIEADITLTSARNLGASEIFRKLSTGEIRFTSKAKKTFYAEEEDEDIAAPSGGPDSGKPETATPDESLQLEPSQLTKTTVGNTNETGVTSSTGQQINSDPNSLLPSTPSPWQPPMAPPPEPNQSPFANPSNNSVEENIKFTPPPPSDEIEDLPTEPVQEPDQQTNTWITGEVVTTGTVTWNKPWPPVNPTKGVLPTVKPPPSIDFKVFKSATVGQYAGNWTRKGLVGDPDKPNLERYISNSVSDIVSHVS